MNRGEVGAVLQVLSGAYFNSYKNLDAAQKNNIIMVWAAAFEDEPKELVMVAVQNFVFSDVKGFPPTIGQIKEEISKIKGTHTELTELDAWQMVYKAISNSGHNSKKEYEKLPRIVQKAVGDHKILQQWAMMEIDTVQSVIQSNFMRSFHAKQEAENKMANLPEEMKAIAAKLSGKMMLEGE